MRKEVIFFVVVFTLVKIVAAAQLAQISSLPARLNACENTQFLQSFEVSSDDPSVSVDISPKEVFFVRQKDKNNFEIFSANLSKKDSGKIYNRTIFATDKNGLSYKVSEIYAHEVNNPPIIEDVRVQTISLDRKPSLSRRVAAKDLEDGTEESGKLKFNTRFKSGEPIFEIGEDGKIEFTTDKSKTGTYLIEVCVRDSGLANKSNESLSACGENGSPKTACDDFQLTVTEKNRQPTIVSRFPSDNFNASSGSELNFEATTFDPDGSAADVYWYADGKVVQFDSGLDSLTKKLNYTFACEKSGLHEIKAEVSDGLLNDSVSWKINLQKKPDCAPAKVDNVSCQAKWGCSDWNVCQHAAQSKKFGSLPNSEYQNILLECNALGLSQENCGFQIRNCLDVVECNSTKSIPKEIQACNFVLNPSCSDGIKNCHDGSCEIGVDCGGNCGRCPSCSDGIKNQNEEGVDCGGNCENACPTKESLLKKKIIIYFSAAVVFLLVAILLYKFFSVMKIEKELTQYEK